MASHGDWPERLHDLDRAAWSLAAIVVSARSGSPEAVAVAELLGLGPPDDPEERHRVEAMAAAPLLQASKFVLGGTAWDAQDDAALLAQGRASAAAAKAFPQVIFPQLSGAERLISEPIRMLDIGVGVAAMAIALCQELPQLSVVGVDVLSRPLELARENIVAAGLGERVQLRRLDVAELDDVDAFDLAWLPAPFIPRQALEAGLERVARAIKPGGWVLLAHGRLTGEPIDVAVTRFKTVAYGGTPLDDDEAEELLAAVGLIEVTSLVTPRGSPALAAGRRGGWSQIERANAADASSVSA